jgi:PAS domain S-box-containing protein
LQHDALGHSSLQPSRFLTLNKPAMPIPLPAGPGPEAILREFQYRTIFETTGTAMIIVDEDTTISLVNKEFEDLCGYSREDIEGKKKWTEFFSGEDLSRMVEYHRLRRIEAQSAAPKRYECRLIDRDGEWRTISVTIAMIPDTGKSVASFLDMTEQKEAEVRLKESEKKYRTVVESSSDAILMLDRHRDIISCNRAFRDLFGFAEWEAEGKSIRIVHPSEDKFLRFGGLAYPVVEREDVFRTEWDFVRKDGTTFPGETVTSAIREGDDITGYVGIIRDISDRRKADEDLRASERKFRSLFESSADAMLLIDGNTFVDCNEAAVRMMGCTGKEQLLAQRPSDLSPRRQCDGLSSKKETEQIATALRNGTHRFEWVHRRMNGEDFPVEVLLTAIPMNGRRLLYTVWRDIAIRKKAEKALRESEERFRQIFEQNRDALILLSSPAWEVIDANPAAMNLYGYGKDEMRSMPLASLFRPGSFAAFEQTLKGAESWNGFRAEDLIGRTKEGRELHVAVHGKPITLRNETVICCSIRDVTESLRMKEEAALLHSKLIQANKMSSLGVLVSSVAHEINNPNNFIAFNASLLADAWRDAVSVLSDYERTNGEFLLAGLSFEEMRHAVAKLLEGITEGSQRIKGIVDSLRDFARQENGSLNGLVDINMVVKAAITILSNKIKKRTGRFRLSLGQNLPCTRGSKQQLEQVIINLVMNGLQALPDRERGVLVSTLVDARLGCLVFEVRDEGSGMTKEVLGRITEPFFTTRLDSGGTGLGLSISNMIIREHRGSIDFESEPGKGTRVTVRLPICESDCEGGRHPVPW